MAYNAFETSILQHNIPYVSPVKDVTTIIHMDDPASAVMIDFNHECPFTIEPGERIANALFEMKAGDVHYLLVCNDHEVLGLITTEDILGEKPIKISQERRIHRDDIQVQMLMTPPSQLLTIPSEKLRHAKVGHIIETLRKNNVHQLLVVDYEDEEHLKQCGLIGIFTTHRISKHTDLRV